MEGDLTASKRKKISETGPEGPWDGQWGLQMPPGRLGLRNHWEMGGFSGRDRQTCAQKALKGTQKCAQGTESHETMS